MIKLTTVEAINLGSTKTDFKHDDVVELLIQLKNVKKERDKFSTSLSTIKNQTSLTQLKKIKKIFNKDPFIQQEFERFLIAIKLKLTDEEIKDLYKYLGM